MHALTAHTTLETDGFCGFRLTEKRHTGERDKRVTRTVRQQNNSRFDARISSTLRLSSTLLPYANAYALRRDSCN